MARGRRYEESNRQLNMKKVYGTIGGVLLIVLICIIARNMASGEGGNGKITSQTYFSAIYQNKWGVIDSEGNNVIELSYAEMIIVPNEKEDVFLCTYDVDYENNTYKTKVIDASGSEIYTGYDKVEAVQNMDVANNLWYEKEVLRVEKNGKYGLIELSTGKEVLSIEYDMIEALIGTENSFLVTKDEKVGIVDNKGTIIVGIEYSEITNIGSDNKDGYIVKTADNTYGVVDYSNIMVVDAIYDEVKTINSNEYYVVIEDGKEKVINKSGEIALEDGYDSIFAILKSETGAIIVVDGEYGAITFDGDVVVPVEYSYLTEAAKEVFIAKKDDKYGIVEKNGELMLGFDYTYIRYSELADIYIADESAVESKVYNGSYEQKLDGLFLKIDETAGYIQMKQEGMIKYYNFKFEEKEASEFYPTATLFLKEENGKYGYVDAKGEEVVKAIYDDAGEQNAYGFVAVKQNGKWGSLDSNGNVVVEPKYNLEDYLIVDFIGKWHLGKDLNNRLYNQLDS